MPAKMPTITVKVTRRAVGSLMGKLGCCSANESTTIMVQAATTVTSSDSGNIEKLKFRSVMLARATAVSVLTLKKRAGA